MRKWIFAVVLGLGISGCSGGSGGEDNAAMLGSWTGSVPGNFAQLASEGTQIDTSAEFKKDGKLKITVADSRGEQEYNGAYELDGKELKINLIGFGGAGPQNVKLAGDQFTMTSVMGQITFTRD